MNERTSIGIFIVDDHSIIADSLALVFNEKNKELGYVRYHFVGRAESHALAMERIAAKQTRIDLVLIDLQLEGKDSGFRVVEELQKLYLHVKLAILTGFGRRQLLLKAMEMKIQGFISKNRSSHQILEAIEEIMAGNTVADADVDEDPALPPPSLGEPEPPSVPIFSGCLCDGLMSTQRQILPFIAEGVPDAKICNALNISANQLEYRIKGLSANLGAGNRAELIRLARERLHICKTQCPNHKI
jgi:DNA-binding NarL/FixJ family response regulator